MDRAPLGICRPSQRGRMEPIGCMRRIWTGMGTIAFSRLLGGTLGSRGTKMTVLEPSAACRPLRRGRNMPQASTRRTLQVAMKCPFPIMTKIYLLSSRTGELLFTQSPDYEKPMDADGDNVYEIELVVSDRMSPPLVDRQMLRIEVKDDDKLLKVVQERCRGDGLTWETAFSNLQDALAEAKPFDEIWVAGIYLPDSGIGNVRRDRTASFIFDGVLVYGKCFSGTETKFEERDPVANRTVLSGAISEDENLRSLHVCLVKGQSKLDGLVIEFGNANGGSAPFNQGGEYSWRMLRSL